MNDSANINQLTDHLFRHEAGKMVAVLTKIFGTENLQTSEDVIQQTFIDAIQIWAVKGIPDNPSGWLFRVAKNKAIDIIRRNKHSVQYDFSDDERVLLTSEYTLAATMDNLWTDNAVQDDMLQMMFACCHDDISQENQITLILKTLCGFSTSEIAKAFLTSEDTISKRIYRTKEFFRKRKIKMVLPPTPELPQKTRSVLNAIYLLFNEGYNSTQSENLIRKDLIEEAQLLCQLLTENQHTQTPESFALMALMCFHSARSDSRLSDTGAIILLEHQDRSTWNQPLISRGNHYLLQAAFGNAISSYHIEAAIAYEHCIAPNYEATNWERILQLYDWLYQSNPTEIIALNRIVIIHKIKGAATALTELQELANLQKLDNYYLYHSLLGLIYSELNKPEQASLHYQKALRLTKSEQEKNLIRKKLKDTSFNTL